MGDVIALVVILAVVGLAALYVYKAKKRGVTCIGCPQGAKCSGHCAGCSGRCGEEAQAFPTKHRNWG